ncbi:unnamed protein product [Calypogeia fissa]
MSCNDIWVDTGACIQDAVGAALFGKAAIELHASWIVPWPARPLQDRYSTTATITVNSMQNCGYCIAVDGLCAAFA